MPPFYNEPNHFDRFVKALEENWSLDNEFKEHMATIGIDRLPKEETASVEKAVWKRMCDLEMANALFNSENAKLKHRIASLERASTDTKKKSDVFGAMSEFCKKESGKKKMRTCMHPDKLPEELHKCAKIIRDCLEL